MADDFIQREYGTTVSVQVGDIVTQSDCDGIVNSANANLGPGSGVCGAIHRAAGPDLEAFCKGLPRLALGQAVATPGFRLPNRVVIHTCGPNYHFDLTPAKYLADAMKNALLIADAEGVVNLAVPAIGMGVHGYPAEEAAAILMHVAIDCHNQLKVIDEIRFVVLTEELQKLFSKAMRSDVIRRNAETAARSSASKN